MGRYKNRPFPASHRKAGTDRFITFVNNWVLLPDDYYRRIVRESHTSSCTSRSETKAATEADLDTLKQRVYAVIDAPLRERYPNYGSNVRQARLP